MNTKQVEELVGLSRQNIRYYEKEGLLTPCREKDNSYRDYSQEDVNRLKLIIESRKMMSNIFLISGLLLSVIILIFFCNLFII